VSHRRFFVTVAVVIHVIIPGQALVPHHRTRVVHRIGVQHVRPRVATANCDKKKDNCPRVNTERGAQSFGITMKPQNTGHSLVSVAESLSVIRRCLLLRLLRL